MGHRKTPRDRAGPQRSKEGTRRGPASLAAPEASDKSSERHSEAPARGVAVAGHGLEQHTAGGHEAAKGTAERPTRGVRRWALGVAITTMLAWSPSVRNGFAWDDRQLIVENDRLVRPGAARAAFAEDFWDQDERAGRSGYYRPLVTLSYVADRARHGLDAGGFHATNVFLHGIVAALLCLVLHGWGLSAPWAGAAALLFALHPQMAESVAWVSGRTDVIAALFVLLCARLDQWRSRIGDTLAGAAFFAALLSKEVAAFWPAVLLAFDASGTAFGERLRRRWPLLVAGGAYVVLRLQAMDPQSSLAAPTTLPLSTRILSVPHLFGTLILPFRGRIEYGGELPPWPLLPTAALGVAMLWIVVRFARGSGSAQSLVRAAAIGALAVMLPGAAAVLWKGVVADRLLYLPAAMLAGAAVAPLAARGRSVWPVLPVLVGLFVWTQQRIPWWRTERALFEEAATNRWASPRVHLNLAIALHDEGLLQRAWDNLGRAMTKLDVESLWYTRALMETEVGCYDLAIRDYSQALRVDPGYHSAANNLGALLAEVGRLGQARRVLESALARSETRPMELEFNLRTLGDPAAEPAVEPDLPAELLCGAVGRVQERLADARHLNRRALDRMRRGQLEQAGILVRGAIDADPTLVAAWLNLAQWFGLSGKVGEALDAVDRALVLRPGDSDALRLRERLLATASNGAKPGQLIVSGTGGGAGPQIRPVHGHFEDGAFVPDPPPTAGTAPEAATPANTGPTAGVPEPSPAPGTDPLAAPASNR